jgi:16S rRNA (cytidine1402-2'-O)-methyltransferase
MQAGILYVVATPIGHLDDTSRRALAVLAEVGLVAAEDTRRTRALMSHYGIGTRLLACHAHNEPQVAAKLLAALEAGTSVALVSDAGTPSVSDPGGRLVASAHARGVRVVPIPGPSAVTTALSASGMPAERFVFEGFLPRGGSERRARIDALAHEARSIVLFEAPQRLRGTLVELCAGLGGERGVLLGRELTKLHESVLRTTLSGLVTALDDGSVPALGEIVLVVAGAEAAPPPGAGVDADRLLRALLAELPPSQAARIAAHVLGVARSTLYARLEALRTGADVGPRVRTRRRGDARRDPPRESDP